MRLSPIADIAAGLYVDRAPYPDEVIYQVEEGRLGGEISRTSYEGIGRESQIEVRMSLAQAVSFREWLDDKITKLTAIRDAAQSQQSSEDPPAQEDAH